MKYLLDTHSWFWLLEDFEKLPPKTRAALEDGDSYPVGISAISIWEIAMLEQRKRIVLKGKLEKWLQPALNSEWFDLIPLSPEISVASTRLPGGFKSDPADEIIIATARVHEATLITADQAIRKYRHVKTLWR